MAIIVRLECGKNVGLSLVR